MKKTALIVAALMVSGSAIAQSTYDTTTDTDVAAQESMTTEMDHSMTDDTSVDPMADTSATSDTDMSADTGMTHADSTATTTAATGVGGPYQPTSMAMNAPSSKGGYPACDPGPGDDNCIQLYESGVSASTNLAMNRSLGDGSTMMASADTSATWNNQVAATGTATGVGGPYEPVTGAADPYQPPVVREQGVTEATDVAGTDYPACEPGPGDDNCIQLYERGVSGDIE